MMAFYNFSQSFRKNLSRFDPSDLSLNFTNHFIFDLKGKSSSSSNDATINDSLPWIIGSVATIAVLLILCLIYKYMISKCYFNLPSLQRLPSCNCCACSNFDTRMNSFRESVCSFCARSVQAPVSRCWSWITGIKRRIPCFRSPEPSPMEPEPPRHYVPYKSREWPPTHRSRMDLRASPLIPLRTFEPRRGQKHPGVVQEEAERFVDAREGAPSPAPDAIII